MHSSTLQFFSIQFLTSVVIGLLFFSCAYIHHSKNEKAEFSTVRADSSNPIHTINARRDIRKMSIVQLEAEKASLELFLKKDRRDSATMHELLQPGLEFFDFLSEEYQTGVNDFGTSGKLKRHSRTETIRRNISKAIRGSENLLHFHRYRLLKMQLLLPPFIELDDAPN